MSALALILANRGYSVSGSDQSVNNSTNTLIVKGKVKRFRGKMGKRRDLKKAYVTLAEGNTIDVTTGL